jgi:hypothetical protein
MIEESGSGAVPLPHGYISGRPKNILIRYSVILGKLMMKNISFYFLVGGIVA